MTLHIFDLSRYQVEQPVPLDVKRMYDSGFRVMNVGASGGGFVRDAMQRAQYVSKARSLGMGISTYHYLTGEVEGDVQAKLAHSRMVELGGPDDMVHVVDVEAGPPKYVAPTYETWRSYTGWMQDKLGRRIVAYTGDWFWRPRDWFGYGVTPYLWAAPNVGYLPDYPGDDSLHWMAGYGGWANLAVMQYSVKKLFGINVSVSAIRDSTLWTALTGGPVMAWRVAVSLNVLLAQINNINPHRNKASDGSIGDASHTANSDHMPKDFPAWGNDIVTARDFTHDPAHGVSMDTITEALRLSRDLRIKYVIWRDRIFSSYAVGGRAAWQWGPYTGAYHNHGHVSVVGNSRSDQTTSWNVGPTGGNVPTADQYAIHNAHLRTMALSKMEPEAWTYPHEKVGDLGGSAPESVELVKVLLDIRDRVRSMGGFDVEELAKEIVDGLIAADNNPTSEAHREATIEAVQEALRRGTNTGLQEVT